MLTEICAFLRNWFDRDRFYGEFVIRDGQLTRSDGSALPLLSGQYYRIIGSIFNDGVHKLPEESTPTRDAPSQGTSTPAPDPLTILKDEEFSGAVWSMAIPPDFLTLVSDISAWVTNNAEAIASPYQSESFSVYSYTLKSGSSASDGSGGVSWQSQFALRLAPWRKI